MSLTSTELATNDSHYAVMRTTVNTGLLWGVFSTGLRLVVGATAGSRALMVAGLLSLQFAISAGLLQGTVNSAHRFGGRPHRSKAILAALAAISGLLLLAVAALASSVFHQWHDHQPKAPHSFVVVVALLSAIASMMAYLSNREPAPLAYHHTWWSVHLVHLRADVPVCAAVGAGVLATHGGLLYADSVVALLTAVFVIASAVKLLRHAVWGLMDASLPEHQIRRIRAAVARLDGVQAVLRVRGLITGARHSVVVKVALAGEMTIEHAHRLRGRIVAAVRTVLCDQADVMVGYAVAATSGRKTTEDGHRRKLTGLKSDAS